MQSISWDIEPRALTVFQRVGLVRGKMNACTLNRVEASQASEGEQQGHSRHQCCAWVPGLWSYSC